MHTLENRPIYLPIFRILRCFRLNEIDQIVAASLLCLNESARYSIWIFFFLFVFHFAGCKIFRCAFYLFYCSVLYALYIFESKMRCTITYAKWERLFFKHCLLSDFFLHFSMTYTSYSRQFSAFSKEMFVFAVLVIVFLHNR